MMIMMTMFHLTRAFVFFHLLFGAAVSAASTSNNNVEREALFFGSCPNEEDRCGSFLGAIALWQLRKVDQGSCESACAMGALLYQILGGFRCGTCNCNKEWKCGDTKRFCGLKGDGNKYTCLCAGDMEGNNFCSYDDTCSHDSCTASSECPGEQRCVPNTCCDVPGICLDPCLNPNHDLTDEDVAMFGMSDQNDGILRPSGL